MYKTHDSFDIMYTLFPCVILFFYIIWQLSFFNDVIDEKEWIIWHSFQNQKWISITLCRSDFVVAMIPHVHLSALPTASPISSGGDSSSRFKNLSVLCVLE